MIRSSNDLFERSKFWLLLIMIWSGFLFHIPCAYSQRPGFTLDFEDGNLNGWIINNADTNNAFYFQPTLGDNPTARQRGEPSNHEGKYWIGTYEKYQGIDGQVKGGFQDDRPQGVLISQEFTIPEGTLSFLIGGGSSYETHVELDTIFEIERQPIMVLYASGKDSETMERVTWDLTPFAGKRGRIRIFDLSSAGWGHINVDDFRFDEPTPQVKDTITTVTPTPEFKIFLEPDRGQVQAGESVVFRAILDPFNEAVEYRFIFGDKWESEWSIQPIVEHIYSGAGNYQVYVEARLDQNLIGQSDPFTISVSSPPTNRLWLMIIIGVMLVAVSIYIFSRIKRPGKALKENPPEINIHADKNIGKLQVESDTPVKSGFELRLRIISDPGKQDIISEGSLITDERRAISDAE
jgi:hypothetical protein